MKGSFEYARYDGGNLVIVDFEENYLPWPDACDGEYEYDADKRVLTISYRELQIATSLDFLSTEVIKLDADKYKLYYRNPYIERKSIDYKGMRITFHTLRIKRDEAKFLRPPCNYRLPIGTALSRDIPPEKIKGKFIKEVRVLGDSTFTVVDKRQVKI